MVLAIVNYKNISNNNNTNFPTLYYQNNKYIIFFNNLDNPKYFMVFFLTLFFLDIESYLSTTNSHKKEKIILKLCNK